MGSKMSSIGIPLRWADKIRFDIDGDTIWIFGDRFKEPRTDAMGSYETDVDGPHIRFANCKNDDDLREFTAEFGPVVAQEAQAQRPPIVIGELVEAYGATASLTVLRHEREAFRALLEIAGMIQENFASASEAETVERSGTPKRKTPEQVLKEIEEQERESLKNWERLARLVSTVVTYTNRWNDQFLSEVESRRRSESGVPVWLWSQVEQAALRSKLHEIENSIRQARARRINLAPSPFTRARQMISIVLSAFPDRFTLYEDRADYVPPSDLSFGIRPLLFAMMRRDLARGHHFRICAAENCEKVFAANRKDKRCHDLECSGKFNASRYNRRGRRPKRSNARRHTTKRGK